MPESKKIYDLEERTSRFSEKVIDLCGKIKKSAITIPIIDQLIRSATSIGANYFEANGAASKKDFRNKIYICKKEARETGYWLRLLAHSQQEFADECRVLWKETTEFVLIFGKIVTSTT